MKRRHLAAMLPMLAATAFAAVAGEGSPWSEPAFVYLSPKVSSFWHTATNNVLTLPIRYPFGAHSATLSVNGVRYSRTVENLTAKSFDLALPAPTSPDAENVYDLVLTFDNGVVRTAKLGLVQSFAPGTDGKTRCLAPKDDADWNKAMALGRAVLPIPQDTTSLTVNGVAVDTGLDGDRGWYALGGLRSGVTAELEIVRNGQSFAATVFGSSPGFLLLLK